MEDHLSARRFMVRDSPSPADIALFAYTHVSDEGGFALQGHPAICAWIERIKALPGFIAMA